MNPFPRPQRFQRSRAKGARLPEHTVVVTRGTKWGNPFVVTEKVKPGAGTGGAYIAVPTVEDAVECYRLLITQEKPEIAAAARRELRGMNLACWCKAGAPCHADVLIEVANSVEPTSPAILHSEMNKGRRDTDGV